MTNTLFIFSRKFLAKVKDDNPGTLDELLMVKVVKRYLSQDCVFDLNYAHILHQREPDYSF